jgi:GAF domain-containing protein
VAKDFVEFKGNTGMEGTNRVSRGVSLCSLAILSEEPTVFEDATKEPCLLENPLVAGAFGLRFYAGAPITTREGFHIGTVCVVGKEPRAFGADEQNLLTRFADTVMKELESRKILRVQATQLQEDFTQY